MIFVLDDDHAVRDSMQMLLETVGYRVRTFECVSDFNSGFAHEPATELPACVILDVNLPDGDGRSVSTAITSRNPGLPVILMSGRGGDDLAAEAKEAGAIAFLDKPINPKDLFDVITRATAR